MRAAIAAHSSKDFPNALLGLPFLNLATDDFFQDPVTLPFADFKFFLNDKCNGIGSDLESSLLTPRLLLSFLRDVQIPA